MGPAAAAQPTPALRRRLRAQVQTGGRDDGRTQLLPAQRPMRQTRAEVSALPSRPIPAATVRCTPVSPPPRLTASTRASPNGEPQRHPDGPVSRRRRTGRRVPDQRVRDDLGPGDRGAEVREHPQRPVHRGGVDRADRRTAGGLQRDSGEPPLVVLPDAEPGAPVGQLDDAQLGGERGQPRVGRPYRRPARPTRAHRVAASAGAAAGPRTTSGRPGGRRPPGRPAAPQPPAAASTQLGPADAAQTPTTHNSSTTSCPTSTGPTRPRPGRSAGGVDRVATSDGSVAARAGRA